MGYFLMCKLMCICLAPCPFASAAVAQSRASMPTLNAHVCDAVFMNCRAEAAALRSGGGMSALSAEAGGPSRDGSPTASTMQAQAGSTAGTEGLRNGLVQAEALAGAALSTVSASEGDHSSSRHGSQAGSGSRGGAPLGVKDLQSVVALAESLKRDLAEAQERQRLEATTLWAYQVRLHHVMCGAHGLAFPALRCTVCQEQRLTCPENAQGQARAMLDLNGRSFSGGSP